MAVLGQVFLPVVAHSLKRQDSHLIIKDLSGDVIAERKIKIIASNTEQLNAFHAWATSDLYSYQFLSA